MMNVNIDQKIKKRPLMVLPKTIQQIVFPIYFAHPQFAGVLHHCHQYNLKPHKQ